MTSTDTQIASRGGLIRRTLRRRAWPIFTRWALLTTALMCSTIVMVRGTYRSSAFLRCDPMTSGFFAVRGPGASLDDRLQFQLRRLTNAEVLSAASQDPKAAALPRIAGAGDPVGELRGAITVGVIPNTYLIEVACLSDSAPEAAILVNAVVDAFLQANAERSDGMAGAEINNLELDLTDLVRRTEANDRRWKDLVERRAPAGGGVAKAEPWPPNLLEQFRKVRDDLFNADLALARAEAWEWAAGLAVVEAEKKPTSPFGDARLQAQVARRLRMDPEVGRLASDVDDARRGLDMVRGRAKAEGEAAVTLERLESRYARLCEAKRGEIRGRLAAGGLDPKRERAEAEDAVRALRVDQAGLKRGFIQLERTIEDRAEADDAVAIAFVREQREGLRTMQEAVNRRLEQLKFEANAEPRIRPVNKAVTPGRPISSGPRLPLLLAIPFVTFAGVVGLFAAVQARSEAREKSTTKREPAAA